MLALHAPKPVLDAPESGPHSHLVQYIRLAAVGAQDRHSHAMAPALLPLHPLLDAAHRMHEREGVGCHDLPIFEGPHMNAVGLRTAASLQLLDHAQSEALQAWVSHVKDEHWRFGKAKYTPRHGGLQIAHV